MQINLKAFACWNLTLLAVTQRLQKKWLVSPITCSLSALCHDVIENILHYIVVITIFRWRFSNSFFWIRYKIIFADSYMDKNYNIDIFHFDDYLNKQLMGISENQLLMLHVKLMVIFLFPLKGSFAVWTTPLCTWTFQNNCWNAFPVKKLLAATTFHTKRRLRVWLFPRHSTLAHYRDLLNKKRPPVSTLGYFREGKAYEWPTLQAL